MCVRVCVCERECLVAKLFMWLTLEQIKGDASFWACVHHLKPAPLPVNILCPSVEQHNKNQQIRHQWLMWKDKSRKWIWKPPPALCHIPLHSATDKQNTSWFRWTAPTLLRSFPLCPVSQVFDLCGKMWVELSAAAAAAAVVVVPLSTHGNLNKLMSG